MITYEKLIEIEKSISKDVEKEFDLIKNEVLFFLNQNLDLYFLKEFIKHYPPKAVTERAEVLLETLLNYFMRDVIEFVKTLDTEKQYIFFRENIRERIKNKALLDLRNIIPSSIILEKESEIEKTIPIIGSIVLATGGIITAIIIPDNLLLKGIPTTASVLTSVYLLASYKNKTKKLKKKWEKLLDRFLDDVKKKIFDWLELTKKDIIFQINQFYQAVSSSSSPTIKDNVADFDLNSLKL